jgi:hypothetical protein
MKSMKNCSRPGKPIMGEYITGRKREGLEMTEVALIRVEDTDVLDSASSNAVFLSEELTEAIYCARCLRNRFTDSMQTTDIHESCKRLMARGNMSDRGKAR